MKKSAAVALFLLLTLAGFRAAYCKNNSDSGRLLTGRVTDRQDQPLANSIVYLSDSRTRAVKSFIVGADGTYRFPALSPNVDYEVYAQYNGRKSDTKTVSQFDTRPTVTINLKIDTR